MEVTASHAVCLFLFISLLRHEDGTVSLSLSSDVFQSRIFQMEGGLVPFGNASRVPCVSNGGKVVERNNGKWKQGGE